MTTPTGNVTHFTTVDGAPDASWLVAFMDQANAQPEYGAIRHTLAAGLGDLAGRQVIDVGCGTGDDARALARLTGPQGRVVGTDLSEAMIVEARRRNERAVVPVEFYVGDLRRMEFDDGTFDAARAKLVLMHCDDIETAAAELVRVTRPGGRIAIFDYDFDTTTVDHPDQRATREIVRCSSDGHPNNWSGRQLRRRFLDLGVRDLTVIPHTVVMPFAFFQAAVGGRLANAQVDGALDMTAEELAAWWQPLIAAEANGRFFASLTGFALAATR